MKFLIFQSILIFSLHILKFSNLYIRFKRELKFILLKLFFNYKIKFFGNDYGGWYVIYNKITENSIVYSFGIGTDTSFDNSIIHDLKCNVYAFDPTPKSIKYVKKNFVSKKFFFHPYGLSDCNKIQKFFAPLNPDHVSYSSFATNQSSENFINVQLFNLETILNKLGHTHIDILKLDIEGDEYRVLDQILQSSLRPRQLFVEFHPSNVNYSKNECISFRKKILKAGYMMFAGSFNTSECCFVYKF